MTSSQRIRSRLIFFGIILAALALLASLYTIQILEGKKYDAKAQAQYGKPTNALFDRGIIYLTSRDGTRIAGATVEQGTLLYMNPKQVSDPAQTYAALSEFIKVDQNAFMKSAKSGDSYAELAHKVSDTTAASIASLQIPGLYKTLESWRSYPGGTLASQTLGIIGEDSSTSTVEGKYGLERSYENVLARSAGGSSVNIFAELFAGMHNVFSGNDGEGDILTTIEPTVESYLEKILSDTSQTWHPDEIGGIIMNPANGEVVAMASLPTFNGNDTSAVKDASVFGNPLVEHVYEMGSIMKPLTMAAGFDTGAITPTSTYNDTGTMTLNGKTIANYDGRARGVTDMQTILSQSLNIGAATVGLKVGGANMAKYFDSYGLGEKTGIDLPNEATGLVKNLSAGRDIDIATASYGQGIAVSPMEMTRALSILANGGYLVTPHLVREIDYVGGTKNVVAIKKAGPILDPKTVHQVTTMLVTVVDTALKNGQIKNDHYTMAAKTGTAQIPDHVNGGYYTDRYLHSFFGYFPAYDPKFIVFLYQIYPKGAQYASETLTDPFNNLAKFLINYYNIPPDR